VTTRIIPGHVTLTQPLSNGLLRGLGSKSCKLFERFRSTILEVSYISLVSAALLNPAVQAFTTVRFDSPRFLQVKRAAEVEHISHQTSSTMASCLLRYCFAVRWPCVAPHPAGRTLPTGCKFRFIRQNPSSLFTTGISLQWP
jgi:hypothetical protein